MSYRSHADLGGRPGFGPVDRRDDTLNFHAPWEARAMAVTVAMGATGQWNLDMSRSARETLPDYAQRSYYAIWIEALEKLLLERSLVGADELAAGRSLRPGMALARVLRADDVAGAIARGSPTERPAMRAAAFATGDRVRLNAEAAAHHTRLPGYARARAGTIERVHGMHVFADSNAQGLGEDPQWLYTVAFESAPGVVVSVDAWEPYLRRDVP
jgi:nitrile hydratase